MWTNGFRMYKMVNEWFLMSNPAAMLFIVACYLLFVLKVGPKLMASRKPFNLQVLLVVYNFAIVLLSLYISVLAVTDGLVLHLFTESCKPQQGSTDHADKALSFSWWYVMSKVVELADTVFFVLRKKKSQVSFLHVYHHASQVVYSWACLKYLPGEQGVFMGFINSLVHVVMYFYYLVAAMGPKYRKYIWWKKYMTVIQLGQFVVALVYLAFTIVTDCHVSRLLSILLAANGTFLLILFSNFYVQTYKKKVAD